MDFRRGIAEMIIGGAALRFVFLIVTSPIPQDAQLEKSAASSPTLSPSPVPENIPEDQQDSDLTQNPAVSSEGPELCKKKWSPPSPVGPPAIQAHR